MEYTIKNKDNGKRYLHITQNGTGVICPKGDQKFKYKKQNMFISEFKTKNIDDKGIRKFVISIRIDGAYENEGECKLTQMNFSEEELRELNRQIDNILNLLVMER